MRERVKSATPACQYPYLEPPVSPSEAGDSSSSELEVILTPVDREDQPVERARTVNRPGQWCGARCGASKIVIKLRRGQDHDLGEGDRLWRELLEIKKKAVYAVPPR